METEAKVGELVKRQQVIDDYVNNIRNKVNSYLTLQKSTVQAHSESPYSILKPIEYIFDNVNTTEPVLANIDGDNNNPLIIESSDIINLFTNFLTKYTRGRTFTLVQQTGNNTNGGTITYTQTASNTWKALMSSTTTKITDGSYTSEETTQPPYNPVSLPVSTIADNTNVKVGTDIILNNYKTFFDNMYAEWKKVVDTNAVKIVHRVCHTNCHSNCHGSRSRR
jgi:hypothetical protein